MAHRSIETDLQLKNKKPEAKEYRVTIGGGLYVVVGTNGSKIFRWDYVLGTNPKTGKPWRKTFTIGTYPEVKLSEARQKRDDARDLVKSGIDPVQHRQLGETASEENGYPPFRNVAKGWLTTLAGKSKKTSLRAELMVHYLCDGVELDGIKVPGFGDIPTDQVKGKHMSPILVAFEDHYETRRRLLPAARDIMDYGMPRGMVPEDYAPSTGSARRRDSPITSPRAARRSSCQSRSASCCARSRPTSSAGRGVICTTGSR
ncbi:Arm DNA-binding domain-containing protein [Bradyrhizobium sp. B117]|uniref:integrase arm-type DNA-binding domain-containing protein n=1 Tax=Bradyrhizobium sp. B117 TaxID=3140246 RepID=UPI003183F9E9